MKRRTRHSDIALQENLKTKALERAIKFGTNDKLHVNQFSGQVGGISSHKRPLLSLNSLHVLKPLRDDHRGIREITFYETIQNALEIIKDEGMGKSSEGINGSSLMDKKNYYPFVMEYERRILESEKVLENQFEMLRRLNEFLPNYFGVLYLKQPHISENDNARVDFDTKPDSHYLVLEDVTSEFLKPCTIDIKIGAQSYEPGATEEKQKREIEKYPPQSKFGFRIVGMRIFDPSHKDASKDGFVLFSKDFGRSLITRESVKGAFKLFFSKTKTLSSTLYQLHRIKQWFKENDSLHFYASSLLITYDAAFGGEGDTSQDISKVKMIDFSHVVHQTGVDEGYVLGLETIITILKEILEEWKGRK